MRSQLELAFATLFAGVRQCAELCLPAAALLAGLQSAEEAAAARTAAADPDNAALFTLDDRRIEVLSAVNKEELRRKSQLAKDRAAEGKDKRNLYLAREGCKWHAKTQWPSVCLVSVLSFLSGL